MGFARKPLVLAAAFTAIVAPFVASAAAASGRRLCGFLNPHKRAMRTRYTRAALQRRTRDAFSCGFSQGGP